MPAQVVIVLDDNEKTDQLTSAIRANGRTVQPYADPVRAMNSLEQARKVELLITCVQFSAGRGNGRSIALMARMRRPEIKLLFLCTQEDEQHVSDLGRCLPLPVDVPRIVELAESLLSRKGSENAAMDQ